MTIDWTKPIETVDGRPASALAAGISLIRCLVEAHLDAARGLDKAGDEDAAAHRLTAANLAAVADAAEGVTITEEQRREIAALVMLAGVHLDHTPIQMEQQTRNTLTSLLAALQPIIGGCDD